MWRNGRRTLRGKDAIYLAVSQTKSICLMRLNDSSVHRIQVRVLSSQLNFKINKNGKNTQKTRRTIPF